MPEEEIVTPAVTPEETPIVPSQTEDPVQQELDRIENDKRSKLERLQFNKERIEREIAAQTGQQPAASDEDRPLTVREFKALQAVEAQDTAKTLADSIEDEKERTLVIHHLENTIKPSGDAATDLRNARLIVNSVKNGQLAEEALRTAKARTAPSAPSAPPRAPTAKPEFSAEETAIIKAFKLTDDEAEKALRS